ncbi:MAG: cupin domain-containing protein [Saprospiraceae bacterium]|nr:cupin domain-containing protein [Saprospiraceae bacterium]MBK8485617.1 cupin domain-containing protein [Saprospiraceae bacterium]MBK9222846.1 cupin domain-containing protein [Saprospiraceae bacterium]MBK9720113.1 cupin domain-containing protein [Saprospiraceae bacterium]
MHLSANSAIEQLELSKKLFLELFRHGSLNLEIYKPIKIDYQSPHDRDEVYIIISGSGDFVLSKEKMKFQPGDFLFVPAGTEHHFENFSDDFATWVMFYGKLGGELNPDV